MIEASLKQAISSLLSAGYWDFDDTIQHYIDQEDLPAQLLVLMELEKQHQWRK